MLLLWSCSEESLLPVPAVEEAKIINASTVLERIEMKEDRLVLSSQEQLQEILEAIEKDENFVQNLNEKFPSFRSANSAFEAITDEMLEQNGFDYYEDLIELKKDEEGVVSIEPEISMSVPSYLANEKGWLQVGTKVVKFTHDNIYEMDETDLNSFNIERPTSVASVEVFPITTEVSPLRGVVKQCSNMYSFFPLRRLKGEIYVRNSYFFSEASLSIANEIKTNYFIPYWGVTPAIMLKYSGRIRVKTSRYNGSNSSVTTYYLNNTVSNKKSARYILKRAFRNRRYSITEANILNEVKPLIHNAAPLPVQSCRCVM